MKNSTQFASFILLVICSFFFQTGLNAQVNLDKETKQNRIYVSPLNLLNPFGASAQITYGRTLSNSNEIQINYAHRLNYWTPSIFMNDGAKLYLDLLRPISIGGFRIGAEYQHMLHSIDNKQNYVAFEMFYDKDRYELFQPLIKAFEADPLRMHRNTISFNCKLGRKIQLSERFLLEVSGGIGVKHESFNFEFSEDEKASQLRVSIPLNIKIGYSI